MLFDYLCQPRLLVIKFIYYHYIYYAVSYTTLIYPPGLMGNIITVA